MKKKIKNMERRYTIKVILLTLLMATTNSKKLNSGLTDATKKKIKIRFANFLGNSSNLTYSVKNINNTVQKTSDTSKLSDLQYSDYKLILASGDRIEFSLVANSTIEGAGSLILQETPDEIDFYTIFVFTSITKKRTSFSIITRKDQTFIPFMTKNIYSPSAIWRFLDLRHQSIDNPYNVEVYTKNGECSDCAWRKRARIFSTLGKYFNGTGVYSSKFRAIYKDEESNPVVRKSEHEFNMRGIYSVILRDEGIYFIEDSKGNNYFYPLIFMCAVIFMVLVGRAMFLKSTSKNSSIMNSGNNPTHIFTENSDLDDSYHSLTGVGIENKTITSGFKRIDNPNPALMNQKRIASIDVLKGLGIASIIFAKSGGGNYSFLSISDWNGFTFADLGEPSLVFSMGFCITYAFASSQYPSKRWMLISVRSLILLFLGLVYENQSNDYQDLKITGIFQRLAFAYFMLSSLEIILPLEYTSEKRVLLKKFYIRSFILLLFPLLSAFVVYFVEAEGCPKGYQGPGGLDQDHKYQSCTGGIYRKIDIGVFGIDHIPKDPNCEFTFLCSSFDQYGLLGTLNFIFSGYLGSVAGLIHLRAKKFKKQVVRLFYFGVILFLIFSGFFALDRLNVAEIPINKTLWSLNFTILTGFVLVFGLIILKIFLKWKMYDGWPFKEMAMNGTFILFASDLMNNRFPFGFQNGGDLMKMVMSNSMTVSIWFVVAILLNIYRFYVKF